MAHEVQFDSAGHLYIAERDKHVIRKVAATSGVISTLAGTGSPGFSGDGKPANRAQLRQPHSIAVDPRGRRLLSCDIGNHRVRAVNLATGIIESFAGTGERQATPDGARLSGTPLNGPRTIAFDRAGNLYLALRDGHAIYRVAATTLTIHHVAGTGEQGYSGDGGQPRRAKLAGPKAWHGRATRCTSPTPRVMAFARSISRPASSGRCSAPVSAAMVQNPIPLNARSLGHTGSWLTIAEYSMWAIARSTAFDVSSEARGLKCGGWHETG